MHEVGPVLLAALVVEKVVVALEPDEPGDLVAGLFVGGGKALFEVLQRVVKDARQRRVPQLALPRGPGAGQFARRLQQGQGCRIGGAAAPPTVRAEGGFGGG